MLSLLLKFWIVLGGILPFRPSFWFVALMLAVLVRIIYLQSHLPGAATQ